MVLVTGESIAVLESARQNFLRSAKTICAAGL